MNLLCICWIGVIVYVRDEQTGRVLYVAAATRRWGDCCSQIRNMRTDKKRQPEIVQSRHTERSTGPLDRKDLADHPSYSWGSR